MGANSKIEWTDATWSPVTGCTPISAGCQNCYAARMAKRLAGRCGYPADDPFRVTFHPERLDEPLRWKKPRRVFVVSMGDLFHEQVTRQFIDEVFATILADAFFVNHQRHTFQVLTKRPEGMSEYFSVGGAELLKRWATAGDGWIHVGNGDEYFSEAVECNCTDVKMEYGHIKSVEAWKLADKLFPPPNVWLGTTVESPPELHRIDHLLRCPAKVRFLSCEPLLSDLGRLDLTGIGWLIAGGESGPHARPSHPDWFRSLRDQCAAAGVPYFFKQWGTWLPEQAIGSDDEFWRITKSCPAMYEGNQRWYRTGKTAAGCLLDGREHKEFPA